MKMMLIKTHAGLHGATEDDHEAWLKFKRKLDSIQPGKYLRLEYATPRNGKHHRKMMALLNLVTQNSETYNTIEKALVAIKLCVGHFEAHLDPTTGKLMHIPKSIAYESMGQEEFEEFYNTAIDAVLMFMLPQFDKDTAERLCEQIVSNWG